MTVAQIVSGSVLVAGLLTLAVYYGWRQLRILHLLRAGADPASAEAVYRRRQARLRLASSGLWLLLAALLAVLLIAFESPAQQLADDRNAAKQAGEDPQMTPEQRDLIRTYTGLVIAILLVLMNVVALAGVDLWVTRRFAMREHRKLQADRRDMIARQAARLRQERNGHN